MIKELVKKNRSCRRFYGDQSISRQELLELVDIARNTASGGNRQPIRYKLVCDKEMREKVYECLGWAAYYKDWTGPETGERPSAYIILTVPEKTNPMWDEGISAQTILLAAVEKGMAGCMLADIRRDKLATVINLPQGMKIDLCIALGYQKEKAILEDIPAESSIKYYRDDEENQHVPKIRLKDLIF